MQTSTSPTRPVPAAPRAATGVSGSVQQSVRRATPARSPAPPLLFVGAYVGHGAGSRAVSADIAARLAERGARVHTVSHRTHPLARLADLAATIVTRRDGAAVAHVDVFSGRAFRWAEVAVALLRARGTPVVCTLHGGNLPALFAAAPDRVRRLLARVQRVTAPSPWLRDLARPLRDDVHVLPNPVDLTRFAGRRRDRARPRLVWVRALHAIYAPDLALDVVARLRDEFPDVHLRLVGPDKDGRAPALAAAIRRRGLGAHVELVGPVAPAEVPRALAAADVFLSTTTIDNTPLSVLEAMAAGCCVVSTAVGGVPHLVRDGTDALLAPAGDAAALAAQVARLLRDASLARAVSGAALATAARHDWERVAPAWEALFHAVAAHRRHAA